MILVWSVVSIELTHTKLCVLFLFLALVAMIAQSNNSEKYYSDLDIDEWDCHECGYHVQVGNICIYCNAKKTK